MTQGANRFVWYELMTTDVAAARAFYGRVVGWQARAADVPGVAYTLLSAGGADVGGMMALPPEAAGAPPAWIGYVGVADVDAMSRRFAAAGGAVHRAPAEIPGVGRFAVVADPQGAVLALFQPGADCGEPPAPPAADTPGRVGWHELMAADGGAAFDFYAGLFGWTKGQAMDMGEMGVYQLFAAAGADIGGMMTRPPEVPAPCWQYYFNVEAIDAAQARVAEAGGQVVNGPMEVPGGHWILHGLDPEGVFFALVAPKR
jgi:hypothetical protein